MPNLNDPDQPIPALQRAQKMVSETQALIEETERAIQHTRALIKRTRSGNAAFASLAQAIDNASKFDDPNVG